LDTCASYGDEIKAGVLRDIVKDKTALGRDSLPLPALRRRLQLNEPLNVTRADPQATRVRRAWPLVGPGRAGRRP
jgi:hypothetical protein